MDVLYWLIRNMYKQLLRMYLRMQGAMLTRRFITERETTGRKVRGALALHRSNALGCSERAEARKFMSVGYRVMLVALLMLVRNDARFKDLSINELDRALLWAVAPTVFGRCRRRWPQSRAVRLAQSQQTPRPRHRLCPT